MKIDPCGKFRVHETISVLHCKTWPGVPFSLPHCNGRQCLSWGSILRQVLNYVCFLTPIILPNRRERGPGMSGKRESVLYLCCHPSILDAKNTLLEEGGLGLTRWLF